MNEGWFSKPVPIAECITGDIRYISSARQALELLDGHWRQPGSEAHREALIVCQRAMDGRATGDAAMQAFLTAATEARVLSS